MLVLTVRLNGKMKMYILIRESVPSGFAILAASHASLACYLKFKDSPEVAEWLSGPFYEAVCRVNDTESALDHQEVAIAFKPRVEWPKPFKFYRLYK